MALDNPEEEKLRVALLRGAELMLDNGLDDWLIMLNNKTTSIADTWHSKKIISFSKRFITVASKEQFDGVALHEVAHALLGVGYGHGEVFVQKCIEISPNDLYARRSADVLIRKYIMTCPECGYVGSHNKDKVLYCGRCSSADKLTKFDVTKNELKVRTW